jgi:uncharacterized membrane protein
MKKSVMKKMFVVGSVTLALAASTIALPSVADAKGVRTSHASHGRTGGHFRGHGGPGGFGGYNGGYNGGYYGGFCGPIQLTLGLCGPWGY